MKNNTFETLIGGIVILVASLFLFLASKIINSNRGVSNSYELYADFNNIDGINIGSDVKIAGVKIGIVKNIIMDPSTYKANIVMSLPSNINIPVDSIFKISTSGLIGGKFINIKIGADEEYYVDKDIVEFTESTMDLEDLISRFIFNSESKNEKK